jgi:hypothetical protein
MNLHATLAIEWNEKEKLLEAVFPSDKLYGQETGLQEVMLEEGPSRAQTRRSGSSSAVSLAISKSLTTIPFGDGGPFNTHTSSNSGRGLWARVRGDEILPIQHDRQRRRTLAPIGRKQEPIPTGRNVEAEWGVEPGNCLWWNLEQPFRLSGQCRRIHPVVPTKVEEFPPRLWPSH